MAVSYTLRASSSTSCRPLGDTPLDSRVCHSEGDRWGAEDEGTEDEEAEAEDEEAGWEIQEARGPRVTSSWGGAGEDESERREE
jgi:hypothetical protein